MESTTHRYAAHVVVHISLSAKTVTVACNVITHTKHTKPFAKKVTYLRYVALGLNAFTVQEVSYQFSGYMSFWEDTIAAATFRFNGMLSFSLLLK